MLSPDFPPVQSENLPEIQILSLISPLDSPLSSSSVTKEEVVR